MRDALRVARHLQGAPGKDTSDLPTFSVVVLSSASPPHAARSLPRGLFPESPHTLLVVAIPQWNDTCRRRARVADACRWKTSKGERIR